MTRGTKYMIASVAADSSATDQENPAGPYQRIAPSLLSGIHLVLGDRGRMVHALCPHMMHYRLGTYCNNVVEQDPPVQRIGVGAATSADVRNSRSGRYQHCRDRA
jgi:hypothetical protein